MLICLSPLAVLLKTTLIIQKEEKKSPAACESQGLRNYQEISRALPVVPSLCCCYRRHNSAEGFRWWSHTGCLAQGACSSWLLRAALPETSAAGGSKLGPADVTNTYACHQHKGQEKSWRGSNLFSSSRTGRWPWGGKQDGTPQDCYSFKAVFVGMPLLDYYCYQKEK